MRKRAVPWVGIGVALVAVLLAGCAAKQAVDSPSPPATSATLVTTVAPEVGTASAGPVPRPSAPADPGTEPLPPSAYGLAVQDVSASGPGRLRFTMSVYGAEPGCVRHAYARVDSVEHGNVFVTTAYDSTQAAGCTAEGIRTVETRVPMRPGRRLVVDGHLWKPGPGRSYVLCSLTLGCHPSADRCAPELVSQIVARTETPPERRTDVVVCSGRWLVLDVDAVMTGCQGGDGSTPPPGCQRSAMHQRWFATLATDRTWQVVASQPDDEPGCAKILRQRPDFPKRLCVRLGYSSPRAFSAR